MFAKLGFKFHEAGTRLLDHIRVNLGEGHNYTWSKFTETVETFLGDPHRCLFNELSRKDKIPIGLDGLVTSMDVDHEGNVCTVKNYKTSPDQFPLVEFIKKAIKVLKKPKTTVLKTKKGKRNHLWMVWEESSHLCLSKIKE